MPRWGERDFGMAPLYKQNAPLGRKRFGIDAVRCINKFFRIFENFVTQ
jgi:hypothetical protein